MEGIKCCNCIAPIEDLNFCKHGERVSPTPICPVCGSCWCSRPVDVARFYDQLGADILDMIQLRAELEARFAGMITHSDLGRSGIEGLRKTFTASQVNVLLRFISDRNEFMNFPQKAYEEGLLPKQKMFSAKDLEKFRAEAFYPVKIFDFGESVPKVIFAATTAGGLKKRFSNGTALYAPFEASQALKFLSSHYQNERDYSEDISNLEELISHLWPERVYISSDGKPPELRIGCRKISYLTEDDSFIDAATLQNVFEKSKHFSCEFHQFKDATAIRVRPRRTLEWAERSESYWKDLLLSLNRASGVVLLSTNRQDAPYIKDFVTDTLAKEGFEVSDFENWEPHFYEGDAVVCNHLHLKNQLFEILELARSVPVIAIYTCAGHPSEYVDSSMQQLFESYIVGHYFFSTIRYVCSCARGVSEQPIKMNIQGKISDFHLRLFEPAGCEKCYDCGYRDKNLLLLPYDSLYPQPGELPSFSQEALESLMSGKKFDFYYASRIFGPAIKSQEVLTRIK